MKKKSNRVIKYKKKKCFRCHKYFIPNSSNETYCKKCRTFKCKNCGKIFTVKNKQRVDEKPKYCSKNCLYKSRVFKIKCEKCKLNFYSKSNSIKLCDACRTFKCFTCEKVFIVNTKQRFLHAKYCSKKCMLNDPKHLIHKRNCVKCGDVYYTIGATKYCKKCRTLICNYCDNEYLVKSYNIKYSKYCSKECFDRDRMTHDWSNKDILFIKNHFLKDMTLRELSQYFSVSIKSIYNAIGRYNIKKRITFTKESLIAEIIKLDKKSISLSYSNMRKLKKGNILKAAWLLFGSWKNAIEHAGLNYNEINLYSNRKKWNTKIILKTIKDLYKSGISLKYSDIKVNNSQLYKAAVEDKNIGSWKTALELLGIDYDEIRGTPWGNKYLSFDGNIYFSILEGKTADKLYEYKKLKKIIKYKNQVRLSKNRFWTCDFLITLHNGKDIWLEVDGLMDKRDNPYILKYIKKNKEYIIYSEKIKYYIDNNFNYKIIYSPNELDDMLNNYININRD